MLEFWKSFAYTTKFSTIAFFLTGALGLLSMGFLGLGLYYLVFFLFPSYPDINEWHGDWVWPVIIGIGMAWSLGFAFGGVSWHYLSKTITSISILRIVYVLVLWLWAAFLWFCLLKANEYRFDM